MALLLTDKLSKIKKERNSIHGPTTVTYTTFISGGKHFFQIDTYGSYNRLMQGKISQSIQLDEETAKIIIQLLKKEFHLN